MENKKGRQKGGYGRHHDITAGGGMLYNSDMHKTDE